MILDIVHKKDESQLEISYIKEDGQKDLIRFNASKFNSYYFDESGNYTNWDGRKCSRKLVSKPSKFDIKEFIAELPNQYSKLIKAKTFPKLYTCDIETHIDESKVDSFPYPEKADQGITAISVASPNLNVVVFGVKPLTDEQINNCQKKLEEYVKSIPYAVEKGLVEPKFKFVYCETEEMLLKSFLVNIVSKCSVLAGWNFIRFDWQYICNRIKNYYPNLSVAMGSCTGKVTNQCFTDDFTQKRTFLPFPDHTAIFDYMELVKKDFLVMPVKESMGLDYIAGESLGAHKIEYDGSLEQLFNNDWETYVFYNCIDSVLVQLVDMKFARLVNMEMQGQLTDIKLTATASQIALTEALFFQEYHKNGYKVIYEEKHPTRGKLEGAYVKQPVPGLHKYCCCNDFASLYPSTIITCNLSPENYIDCYYDVAALDERTNVPMYIIEGNAVYYNDGYKSTPKKGQLYKIVKSLKKLDELAKEEKFTIIGPRVFYKGGVDEEGNEIDGELEGTYLDEAALAPYRTDPNYFVSINGHLYKNDRDYAFRNIQKMLKSGRGTFKYLKQRLDAQVALDIYHWETGKAPEFREYPADVVEALAEDGFDVKNSDDLKKYDLEHLHKRVGFLIEYYDAASGAMKILANAMYGGSSHVACFWYNMNVARDITGEARNLILLMETHFKEYWRDNWAKMTDWHKKWGIEVDPEMCKKLITGDSTTAATTSVNKVGDMTVYGDSVTGDSIVNINGVDMTIADAFFRFGIEESWHGKESKRTHYLTTPIVDSAGKIVERPIKRIIKHKTTKEKWQITSETGDTIICTSDHSVMVNKGTYLEEVKPANLTCKDELIVIRDNESYNTFVKDVKCLGTFDDEYVYDIEIDTDCEDEHVFFANGILVHNTDSIYSSYDNLIKTIKGSDKWDESKTLDFLLKLNLEFLDPHNNEYIDKYYADRHAKSVHAFELETIAQAGIWLKCKKRYAQIIMWKDGKTYDKDVRPLKVIGLEVRKSSYPKISREELSNMLIYMLKLDSWDFLTQKLNVKVQELKNKWLVADMDDICGAVSVNNYGKFVVSETEDMPTADKPVFAIANYDLYKKSSVDKLWVNKGIPFGVRAAGNYNYIRNKNGLGGAPIHRGKVKWYMFKIPGTTPIVPKRGNAAAHEFDNDVYFGYEAKNYPKWADEYAPCDRKLMFQKFILDPFNRILESTGAPLLTWSGQIELPEQTLFNFME